MVIVLRLFAIECMPGDLSGHIFLICMLIKKTLVQKP